MKPLVKELASSAAAGGGCGASKRVHRWGHGCGASMRAAQAGFTRVGLRSEGGKKRRLDEKAAPHGGRKQRKNEKEKARVRLLSLFTDRTLLTWTDEFISVSAGTSCWMGATLLGERFCAPLGIVPQSTLTRPMLTLQIVHATCSA
jgi:hypothetical protein